MRNIYRCASADNTIEFGVDVIFGDWIKSGGRLIKDYKRRTFVDCPCKAELLRLTSLYLHTVFIEVFINVGVYAVGHFVKSVGKSCFSDAGFNKIAVKLGIGGNVFCKAE